MSGFASRRGPWSRCGHCGRREWNSILRRAEGICSCGRPVKVRQPLGGSASRSQSPSRVAFAGKAEVCLLYTSPSPRDRSLS
eukprot:8767062-Pyramimonas_sp.AAC.1